MGLMNRFDDGTSSPRLEAQKILNQKQKRSLSVDLDSHGDFACELRRCLSDFQKRQHNALEEIVELKEENTKLKVENDLYQERLRCGIKRVTVYVRDASCKDLESLSFNSKSYECFVEVGSRIGQGEYKYTHEYTVLQSDPLLDCTLQRGVIKYHIPEKISPGCTEMADNECKKQWYLSDMAAKFSLSLGLSPFGASVPKYLPCAKVVLDDGQVAIIEPKLYNFEKITNNMGDGVEDLNDMLSAFAHFVFVESGNKYVPCDFQGDESNMQFTDPEINTWDDEHPEFLGEENNGKRGAKDCLSYHLSENCINNKYCTALQLNKNKLSLL